MVLLTAAYDELEKDVRRGGLTVFVDGAAVLTVARGGVPDLSGVRAHLARAHDHSGALLEAVVAEVVEDYDDVLEQLDDDVVEVERAVFSPTGPATPSGSTGSSGRRWSCGGRSSPLADVVDRLRCSRPLRRARAACQRARRAVDALLDGVAVGGPGAGRRPAERGHAQDLGVGRDRGRADDVAGIYGMNFQHMPELSWRFGYPAALLLILALCTALHAGFHRHGWLGRRTDRTTRPLRGGLDRQHGEHDHAQRDPVRHERGDLVAGHEAQQEGDHGVRRDERHDGRQGDREAAGGAAAGVLELVRAGRQQRRDAEQEGQPGRRHAGRARAAGRPRSWRPSG